MRDGNRLKEKIEIRLDRRQVTSLSVVALLLAASVFALGVMVGKTLVPVSRAAPAPEALLDRLDAQADGGAAPTAAGAPAEALTYQDELTRKLPKLPPPPAAKAPAARPAVVPAEPPSSPAELPRAALAKPDDAPAVKGAAASAARDGGLSTVRAILPDSDQDSGVETVAVTPALLAAPPRSYFTVQVKATQASAEADKFAQRLRAQGFQSLVAQAEVPGKGRWYRVRVGKFESRAQAERYLVDFKRETHLDAFITAAGH